MFFVLQCKRGVGNTVPTGFHHSHLTLLDYWAALINELPRHLSTIIGVIGKGQKNRKIYGSLYAYFVPLSASAKKERVHPTHPKFLVFTLHFFV